MSNYVVNKCNPVVSSYHIVIFKKPKISAVYQNSKCILFKVNFFNG